MQKSGILAALLAAAVFLPFLHSACHAFETRETFIPGEFVSMAEAENGNIFLLRSDHFLISLSPQKTITEFAIPVPPGVGKNFHFTDLAISGNKILLCGFGSGSIFSFDPAKPEKIEKTIFATNKEAIEGIIRLHLCSDSRVRFIDADNNVYVCENQKTVKFSERVFVEPGPAGSNILVPELMDEKGNPIEVKIFNTDKQNILNLAAKKSTAYVQSIDYLGHDSNGSFIFVVKSGKGELMNKFELLISKNGQKPKVTPLPSPVGLRMQRFYRLGQQASLLIARTGNMNGKKGILLKKLPLKNL